MTNVIDRIRIRNGVGTEQLYGTLDAIKAQPELGAFQFRASNQIDGSHNRSCTRSAPTAPPSYSPTSRSDATSALH